MKKLLNLMAAMACVAVANAQTVGIGTTVPDSNAVLDIYSTSKGLLIPRILDTAKVVNPLEGLIIYNKNTRSPYYFNGSQWLSLGGRLPTTMSSSTDKITYQVTGDGFDLNEEAVYSFSNGVSNPASIQGGGIFAGNANISSFNFMKELDLNSTSFFKESVMGTKLTSIEFKVYATGSPEPYLSYRFKNIIIESCQIGGSAGGGPLIESVAIAFENFGIKDWVNNLEFGYNVVTRTISTY